MHLRVWRENHFLGPVRTQRGARRLLLDHLGLSHVHCWPANDVQVAAGRLFVVSSSRLMFAWSVGSNGGGSGGTGGTDGDDDDDDSGEEGDNRFDEYQCFSKNNIDSNYNLRPTQRQLHDELHLCTKPAHLTRSLLAPRVPEVATQSSIRYNYLRLFQFNGWGLLVRSIKVTCLVRFHATLSCKETHHTGSSCSIGIDCCNNARGSLNKL